MTRLTEAKWWPYYCCGNSEPPNAPNEKKSKDLDPGVKEALRNPLALNWPSLKSIPINTPSKDTLELLTFTNKKISCIDKFFNEIHTIIAKGLVNSADCQHILHKYLLWSICLIHQASSLRLRCPFFKVLDEPLLYSIFLAVLYREITLWK